MTKARRVFVGLTTTTVAATALLMPTASAQTPGGTSSAEPSVEVERHLSTSGSRDTWTIYYYDAKGRLRGTAHFDAYGEHLSACDRFADDRTVRAGLELLEGSGSGWAADGNGSSNPRCGHNNLSIAENRDARLYIQVDGLGGDWIWVHT
jgi:hypothetical protein